MTLDELIHNCFRLQSAMELSYLDDLDPVIHLSYQEASEIYEGMADEYMFARDNTHSTLVQIHPIPGTFWYSCHGIRTFVERLED